MKTSTSTGASDKLNYAELQDPYFYVVLSSL